MPAQTTALVVEDDLLFVARLVRALEAMGLSVATARDTTAALQHLATATPALLVVNAGSGRLDACGIARAAKQASPDIRIIAYGPHGRLPELSRPLRAAGVDRVCANSAIHSRLPAIVRMAMGDETGIDDEQDAAPAPEG